MEFQFNCRERSGDVLRTVRVFKKTLPNMIAVIDRLKAVPNFLDPADSFSVFFREDTIFFEVDDVGMLVVSDMQFGYSASVHITFWDGKLRGRELLCQRLADWVIEIAALKLLWTVVPVESRTVVAFAKRVGFVKTRDQNKVLLLNYERRA